MSDKPPKSIAVDFDGTLCDWCYPEVGKIKPGAKEALQRFRELGYRIIIWSCRTCDYFPEIFAPNGLLPPEQRRVFQEMKAWLDDHQIPYDEIDLGRMGKPMCDYYIDDKAVRFENNWPAIQQLIAG